jgi:hypothetical protein
VPEDALDWCFVGKMRRFDTLIQPLSGLIPADFVKCILPQKVTRVTLKGRHPRNGMAPRSSHSKRRLDIRFQIIQELRR